MISRFDFRTMKIPRRGTVLTKPSCSRIDSGLAHRGSTHAERLHQLSLIESQRLALAVYVGARDGVLEQGMCLITQAHGIERRQRKLSAGLRLARSVAIALIQFPVLLEQLRKALRSARPGAHNALRQSCRYIRYHCRVVLPKLVHQSAGLPSQSLLQPPARWRLYASGARNLVLTRSRYITYGRPQFKKSADPMHRSRASLWCRRSNDGFRRRDLSRLHEGT